MNSKDPSLHSGGSRFWPIRAIILLVFLAIAGAAGIALQKARWTNNTEVDQPGGRRFAGRTGGSAPFTPNTRQSKDAQYLSKSQINADGTITGAKIVMDAGIQRTVREIMRDQASAPQRPERVMPEHEIEHDEKSERAGAPATSQWPLPKAGDQPQIRLNAPQTTALSFDGATLTDTGAFPPDSQGAVGPTQFVTFVNGRLRTFTKAGVADGVINVDPDVFFASVMTPVGGSVVLNFTSDPNVRYDRFTARWFLTIIDVPCTNATCTTTAANRVLIAVSDAASAGTITAGTAWTFFQFVGDPGTNFLDYPSLGVDVNALYIGGNMFSSAGTYVGTNGYVVQKSSILGAGPGSATAFANISAGAGAGPESPRGVDNYDSTATEGYFVGPDNASFSTISFRRVSNPGSATPTISANIQVSVPTTTLSGTQTVRLVEHSGNTGGNNGLLDTIDDRFFQAMIRNGRLWSAHHFTVSSAGVASTAATSRNAVRWYEFQNLTTTPTTVQTGTVFDNAATRAAARQYWMPSVIVSGQGHAVLGMTMAGTPVGATPVYVGRLATDTLGTMTGPPTVAATTFGTTTANYNPTNDPGGTGGRRWGDYSHTSLDPKDDMTIWTIQEYNQASNSYAVRVGKLLAPPPAALSTAAPSSVATGQASVNVTITGTSSSGSGFYDPGTNLPAPALPFTHISASVTGGVTVNSVTYTDPTHITLNLSTVGASAGAQNITVTNPDGQTATGTGILTVTGGATNADLAITKTDGVTTAIPGGSTTYTITASNAGPSAATGATVADTFPAALTCTWTCVGAGGGTCTASGSGNINDSANLPSGGSVTYTASCSISASATGTLSNTATVTAPAGVTDPTPGNNSATDSDTLTPQANLAITKTDGVTTAVPGQSVTYTITASNAGPSNVTGATVADTFPAALTCTWTCVGASGGTCTASGSGNINSTANLPSGGSVTYTASCAIAASATGTLSNTATVTAPGGVTDPTPGNNSATDSDTLTPQANLAITKTDGVTTAVPGQSVTYTITASNAGPSNAPGSTVADTFPAALTCTWTCTGANGGTCTASGSGNINDTANLPSGGSVTYTASCAISASATGTLSNTATVAVPGGVTDPVPGNNSATDSDTLTPQANLAITKTDGVTTAVPGGSVTYTITASNAGPSNAPGSTVADTFPAALTCTWTCVGANGGSCTASGSGNLNDIANLPSSGSVTYTASCSISASATGTLSNTATVTASGSVTDPVPGNNSATDTDTLTPQANLGITKTDIVTAVVPGGSNTYTIVASNAGPSNAPGSTVADTFPAALTCTWTCVGANGGTCTASGSGNINDTANLPSGGSVTYTASCTIAANATGTLSNTATVATAGGVTDPTPGNNSATDVDTILAGCPSTLTVNDLGDTGDNNPGDRLCNDGTGKCTLRAALQEANAITACTPLTINFSVTGTINLASALPILAHPNLTITGPGADQLTVRRNTGGDYVVFDINAGVIISLQGLTVSNGRASFGGGVRSAGNLTITECAITGNTSLGNGGGVVNNGGTLAINRSTISGNAALDGAVVNQGVGGGATATLTNTTISGNTATNTIGGIINANFGGPATSLTMLNCTVTGNTSPLVGGIRTKDQGGPATTTLKNVIVANNSPLDIAISGTNASLVSQGNNLASDNGGGLLNGTGDLINANPQLAPLSNYGGPTQTHALLPSSPAINAGTAVGAPANDQRGIARVGNVDIGAFESRGFTLSVTSGSGQSTTVNTAFANPLVATVTALGAGEPVNGGLVTFTPPGSGASASVAGSPVTISGGTATSGTVTANGAVGSYNVAASASGASSINFGLTNGCPTVTILPATLPGGTYNVAYANQTLTASGSGLVGAFTFALQTPGTLPPGLTLSSAGVISGTPTQPGSFTFTVIATNTASGCTGNRTYTITIPCPTINIAPSTLPNPVAGVTYNQPLTGSGGVGPYTFALHAGSSLPPGLNLVGNAITGMPTQTGPFTFTIDVTDTGLAAGPTNCGGNRTYTVTVNCPTISVTPATVPSGTAGVVYGPVQFAQTGGVGTITWSVTSNNLPAGLTLNSSTGQLSGTPTVTANANVTVRATDSNGCFSSVTVVLQINCPSINVTPSTVSAGTVGIAYSPVQFSQTGGVGTITWSVTSSNLPAGLTLNSSTGQLSGTPTVTASINLTVRATDSNSCFGVVTVALQINCPTITVSPVGPALPVGRAGTPYSQTFTQTGGISTVSFTTSAGTLPAGLTLSSAGVLSGTPSAFGDFSFTIRATDSNNCFMERAYTLHINPPCGTIAISPDSLPNGFQGTAYSGTVTAIGGTAPYGFTLTGGVLPNGIALSTAGALTGTPTAAGTYTFTITATDANGCMGTRQYTVIISGSGLMFYPLPTPVRLLDTRAGESGCDAPGAPIAAGTERLQLARRTCGSVTIPANALAITGNITPVQSGGGFLTLFPSNATRPVVASSNYSPNQTVNNVFTVGLGTDGAFKIYALSTTDVVVDVTGYYAPPGTGGLFFHPLPKPIRMLETRVGQSGCDTPGAKINGGTTRMQQGRVMCDGVTIPANALAIVGNATAVAPSGIGYLTIFPGNATQPIVSNGNYLGGDAVNTPFTVGLAPDGIFKIFTTQTTDLVVDVSGYYSTDAVDENGAGLLFSPLAHPVRLLETRLAQSGCFAPGSPITGNVDFTQQARVTCEALTIPAAALGIVGNATAVQPPGPGFLTLWPSNAIRPTVSALNYGTAEVVNRHFTVGLGTDGAFKLFSPQTMNLVIDLSGYFAP